MKFPRLFPLIGLAVCCWSAGNFAQAQTPPPGFKALFNGRDLNGWRGGDTFDHRKYLALSPEKRAEQDAAWKADMQSHWRVEGQELVNDGHGKYATSKWPDY